MGLDAATRKLVVRAAEIEEENRRLREFVAFVSDLADPLHEDIGRTITLSKLSAMAHDVLSGPEGES